MKRVALFVVMAFMVAAPGLVIAQTENHVELGAFADYYRYDRTNTVNFVGAGGRAGF